MAFTILRPMAKANLYEMMQHKEACDLTVIANDQTSHQVHEIAWASIIADNYNVASEAFHFKFSDSILVKLIEFAYKGTYDLTDQDFDETMAAVKFYKIRQLLPACISFSIAKEEAKKGKQEIVVTVGGWGERPTSIAEYFILRDDGQWTYVGQKWEKDFPYQAVLYQGIEVVGDSVYLIGGCAETVGEPQIFLDTCHQFDLIKNTWMEKSFMNYRRCYVATTTLNGKIYALGGHEGGGLTRLRTAEVYDPTRNQWNEISPMRESRSDFAAVNLNGKIIAIGGFNGDEYLNSIEQYDPQSDQWKIIGHMTTPRSGVSAEVIDEKVYIIGGFDGHERLNSVECFSVGLNRLFWHLIPSMTVKRSNFTSCVVNDGKKIMAMGGFREDVNQGAVCNNVEILDVSENAWRAGPDMLTARSALACFKVESKVPRFPSLV